MDPPRKRAVRPVFVIPALLLAIATAVVYWPRKQADARRDMDAAQKAFAERMNKLNREQAEKNKENTTPGPSSPSAAPASPTAPSTAPAAPPKPDP